MADSEPPVIQLVEAPRPRETAADFIAQWVLYLATRDFSITQSGGGPTTDGDVQLNFGDPTSEPYFSVETAGSPYRWRITEARGIDRKQIEQMLRDAGERALSNDFGEDVLYRATLTTGATSLGQAFFANFARLLGDQRRIDGQRRLSDRVLLTFVERDADQPQQLLAPHTDIEVLLFVPGPAPGPSGQYRSEAD